MGALFWELVNRTAETQFIVNLFHFLLAGLTLFVILHPFRGSGTTAGQSAGRLVTTGLLLLVARFGVMTAYFGANFFFRRDLQWTELEHASHAVLACGALAALGGSNASTTGRAGSRRWIASACSAVAGLGLAHAVVAVPAEALDTHLHSGIRVAIDMLALLTAVAAAQRGRRGAEEQAVAGVVGAWALAATFALDTAVTLLPATETAILWTCEQHVLSLALFALAWQGGERSGNLLDRVFVRLNLTFIVLGMLVMLLTTGMERYRYLRLAEERSADLAEFLRGHVAYYRVRGAELKDVLQHREIVRRVVVEFGKLPELREVNIYLGGRRGTFRYTPEREITEEIVPVGEGNAVGRPGGDRHTFQMISLPVHADGEGDSRVVLVGTRDYMSRDIGRYIILVYASFTVIMGLATGMIGIIVAGTDRRLARQYAELRETHRQLGEAARLASLGELAGGMAHAINTPVTSILSLATHLAEGKGGAGKSPRERRSLGVIAEQAQRVSQVVGNLLTLARRAHLDMSRVRVGELVDRAIALTQYRLDEHAVVVRRDIAADTPWIFGDAGHLTDVLANLINNAVDAMPDGGFLVVRVRDEAKTAGEVRVEFADTGCGIPPEHLARIFDPFFTTKGAGRGTGLGLAISHAIVRDHGGRIWADSEVDHGTTVTVVLPTGGS